MTREGAATDRTNLSGLTRRAFVKATAAATGGLALGFHLPARAAAMTPWEVGETGTEINAWLVIAEDDTVTIRVAQSEMGEGVFTSMPMIVAEELDCDWNQVRAEYASANRSVTNNRVYERMGTGGSGAVRRSREYLQQAGASARERLRTAAARRWNVSVDSCRTDLGKVHHDASGRSLRYGELAAAAAKIDLAEEPAIRTPGQFKLLGTPQKRIDAALKVDGSAVYGIDVRVPGMVYATVSACPVWGGTLKSVDPAPAKTVKGVLDVLQFEDAVVVVADSFWHAKKGLDALAPVWDTGENGDASTAAWMADFKADLDRKGVIAAESGDAYAALASAATVIEADYDVPYLAHLALEPVNCTVHIQKDRVDVWTGAQNPESVLGAAAEITGRPPEQVHVQNCFLGGAFGRRSQPDFARRAVEIAMRLGETPVQVIWTREEDTRTGHYRPMSAFRFKAGLDADGKPVALLNRSATHSILAGLRPETVQSGLDGSSTEGLEDQPYAIENVSVEHHLKRTHVPVWFWRSVGHSQNAFARECFVDEMAAAGGHDPYEFRRFLLGADTARLGMVKLLDRVAAAMGKGDAESARTWLKAHPGLLNVLEVAAEKAEWGRTLPSGTGMGIAVAESFGSICAQVAQVSVSRRGEVRVERVVSAIDCGNTINPLTIAEQIESAVIYGLSAALWGRSDIENGRAAQLNFDQHRVLKMAETPVIETHFALSGGDKWGGIGEPGLPPTAPAVVNAIYAVTGKRVRSLPLMQHDLSWT
ncbi:MAG: xanthine dehydrogenase family protein molybdopterin-binding subunit [Pseudomonadales bacterium]|jgi:isoquinoline 1-oxidoreductase beta subunit|nr:xanthine dehydrogenase family protein molybdopterin-binding subunit [Pseudomonadales bacterium]